MRPELNLAKKTLLAVAASAAVAGPILIGLWNAPPLRAQAPGAQRKFAVATIKPTKPGANGAAMGNTPSGDFMAMNQSLWDLVSFAFTGEPVNLGRVSGGPDWAKTLRFDIQAKADQAVRPSELGGMLRALLEDRFKLKTHEESKQMPMYALIVKSKGKIGSGLSPSPPEEAAFCDALERQPSDADAPPAAGGFRRCSGSGRGGIRLRGQPLDELARELGELLGRPVINRTGLSGRYNVDLLGEFNWDHLVEGGPADTVLNGEVFAKMEDQLGLKLESTRGPVQVIVIDAAERPGEN